LNVRLSLAPGFSRVAGRAANPELLQQFRAKKPLKRFKRALTRYTRLKPGANTMFHDSNAMMSVELAARSWIGGGIEILSVYEN